MGRKVAKRVNGSIAEKYLWQDATTLLAVLDATDAVIQRFEYADGRMPVAMTSAGAVYYMAYDQVGSLKIVTDASGTAVKRIDYDSFGNILSDSNPVFSVPFGFAGGLHDRDTGLVRFGARDYDPATGKWTAKDPIDFAGGDLNLLGYCQSDPVNWVDPSGEIGQVAFGVILGAVHGVAAALANCASVQDVIISGIYGGLVGGLTSIFMPAKFVGRLIQGASYALLGNLAGQWNTYDKNKGDPMFSFGSAFGAVSGGAITGGLSHFASIPIRSLIAQPWLRSVAAGIVGVTPPVLLPGIFENLLPI